jgi:transcription initiation factor IIE alpha subunit
MTCPDCDRYVTIEDWTDDEPFNCPHCNTLLKLVTDEGGYCGANEKSFEIQEGD